MSLSTMKAACLVVLVYCARAALPDPRDCKSIRDDVPDEWCATNCVHGGQLHPACDRFVNFATCRCPSEPDPPMGPPVGLKGTYVQLGISGSGKFGVPDAQGFWTRQPTKHCHNSWKWGCSGFGILGDANGFGFGPDLRIDYELPGRDVDTFLAGYTAADGTLYSARNFAKYVKDISAGGVNLAEIEGQVADLKVSQRVGFRDGDKHFRTLVTLTNTGNNAIEKVRYVKSMDPDNSYDMDGTFPTLNTVLKQASQGDSASAVLALGPAGGDYFKASWFRQSRMMYVSGDASSVVSHTYSWHIANTQDIYWKPLVEDAPKASSHLYYADSMVHMTFDLGTLTPGTSKTVSFWTVVDNTPSQGYLSQWRGSTHSDVIDDSLARVDELLPSVGCKSLTPAIPDSWCRGSWPTLPTNCFDGAGQIAPPCRYSIDPHEVQHVCVC